MIEKSNVQFLTSPLSSNNSRALVSKYHMHTQSVWNNHVKHYTRTHSNSVSSTSVCFSPPLADQVSFACVLDVSISSVAKVGSADGKSADSLFDSENWLNGRLDVWSGTVVGFSNWSASSLPSSSVDAETSDSCSMSWDSLQVCWASVSVTVSDRLASGRHEHSPSLYTAHARQSLLHNPYIYQYIIRWLRGVTVKCWTGNCKVVGSTPSRDAIKWLLIGWVTIWGQVKHLSI